MLIHMAVGKTSVVFLTRWTIRKGYLRESDPKKQSRSYNILKDLVLGVTCCHFHNISLARMSVLFSVGENFTRHEYKK